MIVWSEHRAGSQDPIFKWFVLYFYLFLHENCTWKILTLAQYNWVTDVSSATIKFIVLFPLVDQNDHSMLLCSVKLFIFHCFLRLCSRSGSRINARKNAVWSNWQRWAVADSTMEHEKCEDFQWICHQVASTTAHSLTSPATVMAGPRSIRMAKDHFSPAMALIQCYSMVQVKDYYVCINLIIKIILLVFVCYAFVLPT